MNNLSKIIIFLLLLLMIGCTPKNLKLGNGCKEEAPFGLYRGEGRRKFDYFNMVRHGMTIPSLSQAL